MDCSIRIVQINLHHSHSASAVLGQKLASGAVDIALIQEPWTRDGKILGLGIDSKRIFYDRTCCRPRACIYVSSKLHALLLVNHLNGDNVAVKVKFQHQGNKDSISFVSSYLPYEDKDTLSKEIINLIENCQNFKFKLIIGCDANAHHILWGSSDCNKRGEDLLEHILHYNLYTLNCGNEPTFVTSNRREVIDITFCNSICYDNVRDWRVSDEETLSDHRLICFTVTGPVRLETEGRNPRHTKWGSYQEDLKKEAFSHFGKLSSVLDLELAVDQLQQIILESYHQNCKVMHTSLPRIVPWWSKELSCMRSNCRKLFNRAKKNGEWQTYKAALTSYNKAVRDAKRASWNNYCSGINDISATARLVKVMSKDRMSNLNAIKLPNGNYSESGEETLAEMFRVHFPNSCTCQEASFSTPLNTRTCGREKWNAARKVVTYDKIIWAFNSFRSYKTPGIDGIFPALLKEGSEVLTPILCRIFRSCLALGYTPMAWRNSSVIFIPKPGKDNYFEAKSFRPICLTSFLLKTLEKLVDRYIREEVLCVQPLSNFQFAYQPGRSTDTALYHLTHIVERCLVSKEVALAVFLDIEGAFDKVPVNTIIDALSNRNINSTIVNWIKSLLTNRFASATLFGDSLMIKANTGCPQGGVLSPLLWCLVVDSLLNEIGHSGVDCIGYADDIVIVTKGKFLDTVCCIMQNALKKVESWCSSRGLSVNPAKTHMIAFNRRRTIILKDIKFFGHNLTCSSEVKYLGVYLDEKLNWKSHLDYCISRAKRAFWACRNAIGRSWGLSPMVIRWIYSMIICPMITYGCIAWWSRTRFDTVKKDLNKIQRMVCVAMTGCMRTTPTGALELLLGFIPLNMRIEAEAILCVKRLRSFGHWNNYSNYLNWNYLNKEISNHPHFIMQCDKVLPRYAFSKPYTIHLSSRDIWKNSPPWSNSNHIKWYTDGSKMDNGTGAGVCCPEDGTSLSYPLGRYATVFQAEVFAILMCCRTCIDRGYKNRYIDIYSDSQAALLALQKSVMTSVLVWECYLTLCALAANNKIFLYWVPGHTGILGNELADELARKGSDTPFIGPEPVLSISGSLLRGTIFSIMRNLQYSTWLKTEGSRQAKELNCGNPSARAKELMKLNRKSISKVIGLLTGHCRLKRHLYVMGIASDPFCRGCKYKEETATHILCECEVFSAYRFEHLGRHLIEPWELQDIPVRCMLGFLSATGLFRD